MVEEGIKVTDPKTLRKIKKQEIKRLKREMDRDYYTAEEYYNDYTAHGVYNVEQMTDLFHKDLRPRDITKYKRAKEKLTIDEMLFLQEKRIEPDDVEIYTKLKFNIKKMVRFKKTGISAKAVERYFEAGIKDPKRMKELLDKEIYGSDIKAFEPVGVEMEDIPKMKKVIETDKVKDYIDAGIKDLKTMIILRQWDIGASAVKSYREIGLNDIGDYIILERASNRNEGIDMEYIEKYIAAGINKAEDMITLKKKKIYPSEVAAAKLFISHENDLAQKVIEFYKR